MEIDGDTNGVVISGGEVDSSSVINKPCPAGMISCKGCSHETRRFYVASRIILEMLRDRGYVVSDHELSLSLAEFRAVFGDKPELERLRIVAPRLSNPAKKVLVIFLGAAEIRKASMDAIFNQITNKDTLDKVIIIRQSRINSHATKLIEQFQDDYSLRVEVFLITDLLFNVTKHVLEPKHEILSAEEKERLLIKYHAQDKQLPLILKEDAIAKYYGLEKGQVVKTTYSGGPLTNSMVSYRCVG